jgi:hypothetical protein
MSRACIDLREKALPARASLWRSLLALMLACSLNSCADPEPPDPAALIPDWRVYYNRELGIELRYPYTLSLDAGVTADDQLLLELQWVGRGTVVFKLETLAAVPGVDAVVAADADRIVGGEKATMTMIEVDGEKVQRLRFLHDGRVYIITGAGSAFEKILDSVTFFEPGAAMPPGAPSSAGAPNAAGR